ncbi:MFS transporter [Microbacterium sp. SSW1-59]|uniref:MFS transporter n=1 Tax=Microbacterium xanthum TaxID=3079794 RepID=UPI002AD4CBFC|nr:MFS transporter [Microbacterium sp. SSW1-59]MDZ8202612.1 MFS transporter [Microbacterium sp. SSW1-59]
MKRPTDPAARAFPWLVVAGILVSALSFRGHIVAPTPVLRDIEVDLGIPSAQAGLLTTAPVLMFAVLTPLAAVAIRRAGPELALMLSLVGVLAGTVIRTVPGFGALMLGMVVIGAAVTIGNVVTPVIIRRDVPSERVGVVTAAYTATLNVGTLLTTLLTAPMADVVGWPLALFAWALLTIAGIALWSVYLRRERRTERMFGQRFSGESVAPARVDGWDATNLTGPTPVVSSRRGRSYLARPVVWLLLAAFASQAFLYYGFSTWLPTMTADLLGVGATSAGALASLFQGVGIVGALLIPVLTRFTPRLVPAAVICASWIVLALGMLAAPELLWVWVSIGAMGHAGGFVVIFSTLVAVSRNDSEATGMSALVQGGGYALGATAAPVLGGVHDLTGSWQGTLWLTLALAIAYAALLMSAVVSAARAR